MPCSEIRNAPQMHTMLWNAAVRSDHKSSARYFAGMSTVSFPKPASPSHTHSSDLVGKAAAHLRAAKPKLEVTAGRTLVRR